MLHLQVLPYIRIFSQIADPTSALPGWLAGGGLSAIFGWLLARAEKRLDATNTRLDACEERYRDMVERNMDKTYDAVAQLSRVTDALREQQNVIRDLQRGRGGGDA